MDKNSILITGCSCGIGLYCATFLKKRGYKVFATARKKEDVKRLKELGFDAYLLDLTKYQTIHSTLESVLKITGGTLYALFNNGAYGQPGAVEDLKTSVLKEQFETNFFGWHELTRNVIKIMRKQGYGRIIQHSSILGLISLKFRGAYNSSKYALEGLTDTLRLELKGSNIYISTLNTGPIKSNFRKNAFEKFKENIDIENSFFKDIYKKEVQKRLSSSEDDIFTLNPDAVAKKVIHILESKKPKARYYITFPSYLLSFLKRALPTSILDEILYKI